MSEQNHDHHDANCDCGHEHEEFTVTLTLDNDEVLECSILTIYDVGEHSYIALLPLTQSDDDEGDVLIYRYVDGEDEEPSLENIESDDEYEIAADAFDEWLDEQEFNDDDVDDDI